MIILLSLAKSLFVVVIDLLFLKREEKETAVKIKSWVYMEADYTLVCGAWQRFTASRNDQTIEPNRRNPNSGTSVEAWESFNKDFKRIPKWPGEQARLSE